MRIEEAQALEPHTPVKVSDSEAAQRRYGIHAGQVLDAVEVWRNYRGQTFIIGECEDEHRIYLQPRHATVEYS